MYCFLLGNRPYICWNCGKTYIHKQNLGAHIKYECGKEPQFLCMEMGCQYKSKRKENLARHYNLIHIFPKNKYKRLAYMPKL